MTITDNSAATADIDSFAVVSYDSSGTEPGSDNKEITEQFITTGPSQTWIEYTR